ncbi:hypothetical protein AVEN_91040-1 [Araneus ventricosus]|uniref:Uncharacterized protein n=1 Tax=Araneus ventricosus TaxID=182803 RepID=A0A4Y2NYV2_ARAVE|nr:hypothetical protein AVEN_91040-1 [Araneus ventricosus]
MRSKRGDCSDVGPVAGFRTGVIGDRLVSRDPGGSQNLSHLHPALNRSRIYDIEYGEGASRRISAYGLILGKSATVSDKKIKLLYFEIKLFKI